MNARHRDEAVESMKRTLVASRNHLLDLRTRLATPEGLNLREGEKWLPADIEFARRYALQYAGPGVPTNDAIELASTNIEFTLREYERTGMARPMNAVGHRIFLTWRTMGTKRFWEEYGPGSNFSFSKCDIPPKPIEIPNEHCPYSVYEEEWKEMAPDFPQSGVDWNLIYRFEFTDDDEKDLDWKTNLYGVLKNFLLYGTEPSMSRKRKKEDEGNVISDGGSMYHRSLTNFRKLCKVSRYNMNDGEIYIIDYFPHPSERDSIGRPISNDVTSFKLRKYRIVPASERGDYLTCMWKNPTKGSHRGRDSFYYIVTQTVVGISRKFVGEWVKNQEWYVPTPTYLQYTFI
jgi:hypothetical protein